MVSPIPFVIYMLTALKGSLFYFIKDQPKSIESAMNLDKSTLRTVKKKTEDPVIPYVHVSIHNPKILKWTKLYNLISPY